jgi:hypothetical protein
MSVETLESPSETLKPPPATWTDTTHDGRPCPPGFRAMGIGRKRGSVNRLTRERREFIDMVIGMEGSDERKEFAARIRQQFMNGTINPQIATTIMHWWLGKPKDTIEVKETPANYAELTDSQLAERAMLIAKALAEKEQLANTIDIAPPERMNDARVLADVNEPHP